MKKKLTSPNGLTATGMGPIIMGWSLPFLLAGILIRLYWPQASGLTEQRLPWMVYAGTAMVFIGALLWISAVVQFSKAFPKGELITTGAYRISRNPIYASWAVLILPGLALWCNNWCFLAAAASMYIALVVLVEREEKQLRRIYTRRYLHYCEKVGKVGILPILIWK